MEQFISYINLPFWALQTVAMLLTCLMLPKLKVDGILPALLTVVALSFINANLWDAALFLNIPDTFTLKSLLLVVSNGVLFWIVVKLLPGISISGVRDAVLAPLIFSAFNLLIDRYHQEVPWKEIWETLLKFINETRLFFLKEEKIQ